MRQIRSSLDKNSAVILANSLVHSKIDYCNSLLVNLPDASIMRLQRVQNSLARVVCNSTKRQSHSLDLLKSLHWLPITERIKYKIAVLTFKVLQHGQPSYLSDLISLNKPRRNLRSSDDSLLLAIPAIRTAMGRRSFSYASPTILNALPFHLRSCSTISSFCISRLIIFPLRQFNFIALGLMDKWTCTVFDLFSVNICVFLAAFGWTS